MKPAVLKIISWTLTFSILAAAVFYFKDDLTHFKDNLYKTYLPCQKPIEYSLGTFDTQFGISQEKFLAAIASAEKIWEEPSGRDLFTITPSATLKINLVYDYRQAATAKLNKIGADYKAGQKEYDQVKARYDELEKKYQTQKTVLENDTASLNSHTAVFNAQVASWNRRGGAPADIAAALKIEGEVLNQAIAANKAKRDEFNALVNNLNDLGRELNTLGKSLNLSAVQYNTVGATRGEEFEEGVYVNSAEGEKIDIYEFESNSQLVRVLAHELGHALGLGHVSTTKAIMYYLNNGVNEKLTPADQAALQAHCQK